MFPLYLAYVLGKRISGFLDDNVCIGLVRIDLNHTGRGSLLSNLIEVNILQNCKKPRFYIASLAQISFSPDRPDEGLLDEVFRIMLVPRKRHGVAVEPINKLQQLRVMHPYAQPHSLRGAKAVHSK